jgi:hypothetical protein
VSLKRRFAAVALVSSLVVGGVFLWRHLHPKGHGVRAGDLVFSLIPAMVTQIEYGTPAHAVRMTRTESESPFSVDELGPGGVAKAHCTAGGRGADAFSQLFAVHAKREVMGEELDALHAETDGPLPVLRIADTTAMEPLEWRIVIGGPNHDAVFALDESYGLELEVPVSVFTTLSGGCATLAADR